MTFSEILFAVAIPFNSFCMENVEENEDINKLDKTIFNTFLDLLLNTLIAELKALDIQSFWFLFPKSQYSEIFRSDESIKIFQ